MAVKSQYPEQLKTRKDRHKLFVIPFQETVERLSCIVCKDILVDPHQTECGCRCCQSCLNDRRRCEDRCPGCHDIIMAISNNIIPDKDVEMEIFDLEIRCLNEKCDYKCQMKMLSEHLRVCEFRETECDKCGEICLFKDKVEHEGFQCKMSVTKCDQCGSEMTKKDLDEIHRNVAGNIEHLCDNWTGVCPLRGCGEVHDNMKVHLKVCTFALHARLMTEEIVRLKKKIQDLKCHLAESEKNMAAMVDVLKRSVEEIAPNVATLTNRAITSERLLADLQAELMPTLTSRDYIPSLQNQCSFEWRVCDIRDKIKDASAGNNSRILVESFYAGRYGPRIYLKMYPDGNGSSRGSHLSLDFIIMQEKYDGDVDWPYSSMVSLTLKSYIESSKDLTVNMIPRRNNSAYERPNHNVVTGQLLCLLHSELAEYVNNGSIVIRIKLLYPYSPRNC